MKSQHQLNLLTGILVVVILQLCPNYHAPAQRITKPNESGPIPGLAVNTFSGNLVYQRTDLTIPGRGISLNITFTYNSGRNQRDWGYGHGWSFSYGMGYRRSGDTVFIDRDDGQRDPFMLSGSQYLPPTGVYEDL
ncbi:MAG: DUF6531 domain-containing protein, partial [Bacteroidia bacterium]|nr:DUF6531 domain-containing protein [Bacteroidia bacterium]